MRLYTINNKHANTYCAFNLVAEDFGASPTIHEHSKSDITSLIWKLSTLAAIDHTHPTLKYISVNGNLGNQITKLVDFALAGGITLSITGSSLQFDITDQTSVEVASYVKNTNLQGSSIYGIAVGEAAILSDQTVTSKGNMLAFIQGI